MRLRRQTDFGEVKRSGERVPAGPFVLNYRHMPVDRRPRLGIIASRRVGRAVDRNRGKRLVREAFRHLHHRLPRGLDLVVILRASIQQRDFADVYRRLERFIERLDPGAKEASL